MSYGTIQGDQNEVNKSRHLNISGSENKVEGMSYGTIQGDGNKVNESNCLNINGYENIIKILIME